MVEIGGNWLITGGCGFIGRRLIELWGGRARCIRVVDNLSVGGRADLAAVTAFREVTAGELSASPGPGVELVAADIRDAETALRAAEGMDVIIHLAANTGVEPSVRNPRLDCESNVLGTLNYLEAARLGGVRRFVFASSSAPVGECTPPVHEELAARPVSPYGASKLAGEGYCSAYKRTFGIETVALRFSNVYGPLSSHKSSVVASFLRAALAGQEVTIHGDGSQTRDFLYIDDLVEAVVLAMNAGGAGGEAVQIATGRETSINELLALLDPLLAGHGVALRARRGEPRLGDVPKMYSLVDKAERLLGWKPRTSLAEGLEKAVAWFLAESRSS